MAKAKSARVIPRSNNRLRTIKVYRKDQRVDPCMEIKTVESKLEESVLVNGRDELELLYNWLELLIVNFETKNKLYSKFKILTLKKKSGFFSLTGKIWGENFDPKKHVQKVGVKAITYHRMKIIKDSKKVTLEFILDI